QARRWAEGCDEVRVGPAGPHTPDPGFRRCVLVLEPHWHVLCETGRALPAVHDDPGDLGVVDIDEPAHAQQGGAYEDFEGDEHTDRVDGQREHRGATGQATQTLRLSGLHRDLDESHAALGCEYFFDDVIGALAHPARRHDRIDRTIQTCQDRAQSRRVVLGV